MSDVNFVDNSQIVLKELNDKIGIALEAIGEAAEGHAQDECPVDTGRLKNSIAYTVNGNDVYIGTNVEYAPKIEFTDMEHRVGNAHFLKNAAVNHSEEYKNLAKKAMM